MSRGAKSAEARQFDEALGRRMEAVRKRAGIKGTELAAAAGISQQALNGYESGRTSCPPIVLWRIAAALAVSVTSVMPKTTNSCYLEKARQGLLR
jgi:transcriptional regulator with XRE-family HTH domain